MKSTGNTKPSHKPKILGTFSDFVGVQISVTEGAGLDYLELRAAQLAAINHLMTAGEFEGWSETIKSDAKSLAATLAAEVVHLIPLAIQETVNATRHEGATSLGHSDRTK